MAIDLKSNTGLLSINGMTCIYNKLPNGFISISYRDAVAPPNAIDIAEFEA